MTGNRTPLDLGAMGGTPGELLERMQILTATFSKMMGKDFDLVNAPSGSTDCATFFRVPLQDPEAYLILEHEISHPFGGTDLELTEAFRAKAVERLLKKASIPKTHPDAIPYTAKLEGLVHHLWNVLEDWRCCSVWGELYAGGADLLRQRWHDIAANDMEDQAEKDLISYLGRIAAGVETPGAPDEFKACAKHMKIARSRVELVDNKACIALTSRLVDDIADELLKQFPPDPQQNSTRQQQQQMKLDLLNKAISNMGDSGKGHGDNEDNPLGGKDLQPENDPTGRKRKKKVSAKKLLEIQKLMTAKDDDSKTGKDGSKEDSSLEKLLKSGTEKMFSRIQVAKKELGKAKKSRKRGQEDILLSAAKVSGIRGSMVTPSQRLPSPTPRAARMRRHLENVKMKKEMRRAWTGQDLDIESVINAKISNSFSTTKLFKETRKYGGMDLLVLMDVSGSMAGWGMDLLDQAVANIDFACKGVNVRLQLWGFSSELFFFSKVGSPKNVPGLTMGMTSMVQALDAAWEWAKTAKTDRAVLMITDGFPTSCRGRRSTGNAVEDLHAVLREMRVDGIVVSILGIGSQNSDYYDNAFGVGRYGLVATVPDLPKALEESARVMIESHMGR